MAGGSAWNVQVGVKLDLKELDKLKNRKIDIDASGAINAGKDLDLTYQAANRIFTETIQIIGDLVSQTFELNSAMTEFQKVSDLTGDSLDSYVSKLGDMGETVARTASEMVQAATEFRKSGFDDQESAGLAVVASMYQNVADEAISAGEASNFIISQMKAFNLEASDAEHIIDAVNEVSNNFAVSSSDIATNIGKASAALAVGNNTYEQTVGLMTGIIEITRSGTKASRGLVSIQSRLNQIVDESSSTGQALTKWYNDHNIAIYDQAGQLRSLYDILEDTADIWPKLTKNEQLYYLNQQAGEFAPLQGELTETLLRALYTKPQ